MALEQFRQYLRTRTGATDEQADRLLSTVRSQTVEKGAVLLREGEICRHSFFVEQGLLRAYTIDEAGKEHVIQFAPETWIVSDRSSSYFDEPSDLNIEAIEKTTVVFIDRTYVETAAKLIPGFREFNETALHNHIRHQQKRINLLLGAQAEKRYLDFIGLYPDLTLRVPQWMIASYLGITPESLSRVRKELAKRNFKG